MFCEKNYFERTLVLKISISLKGRKKKKKQKGKPVLFVLVLSLSWKEDESTPPVLSIQRTCSQLTGWASVKEMAQGAFPVFDFVLPKKNCRGTDNIFAFNILPYKIIL